MNKKPKNTKILCTTCGNQIKTKKPDVPRIATKPYCVDCYIKKKYAMKTKPRFDGSGRKFTFKRWNHKWKHN